MFVHMKNEHRDGATLDQIGVGESMTRERVRQIEERALDKLRLMMLAVRGPESWDDDDGSAVEISGGKHVVWPIASRPIDADERSWLQLHHRKIRTFVMGSEKWAFETLYAHRLAILDAKRRMTDPGEIKPKAWLLRLVTRAEVKSASIASLREQAIVKEARYLGGPRRKAQP